MEGSDIEILRYTVEGVHRLSIRVNINVVFALILLGWCLFY